MNLLSFHKVYEEFGKTKSIPEQDMVAIVRLKTLHEEIIDMAAFIRIDRQKITEAAKTCAKAWTCLLEAMQEIYLAGQYVFRKQPQIESLFYMKPFQEFAHKRKYKTGNPAEKIDAVNTEPSVIV